MTTLAGIAALVIAALFTGAAFYINVVEHPARMMLEPTAALRQWEPAYARGYAMQATLAIMGTLAGGVAWWQTRDPIWIAGSILMLANWPWTLLVIMPVNQRLKDLAHSHRDDGATELLHRWARLHAVRTVFGSAAVLCFVAGLAAR